MILPDDPSFDVELAFDFNVDSVGVSESAAVAPQSSLLSLPSYASSQSSRHEPQLLMPSSESPAAGGLGFGFPGDTSSLPRSESIVRRPIVLEEESGLLPDPGFYFDKNGEEVQGPALRESSARLSAQSESRAASESAIARQVQTEHEAGLQGGRRDVGCP